MEKDDNSNDNNKTNIEKEEFTARCHCGRVQVKFWADPQRLVAWDCDCSDCHMRRNVHLVVPKHLFRIDMEESLDEATTLYLWGTKTAQRRFCKTCGACTRIATGRRKRQEEEGGLMIDANVAIDHVSRKNEN